jgi:hypothetical protein
MPGQHARLSASGSKVWINCPGSVKLTEGISEESSPFATEGTICHELGEMALRERLLGDKIDYPLNRFNAEMFVAIATYRSNVEKLIDEIGPDPVVFVEQRVEFGSLIGVPGMFGTSDCILLWPEHGVVATVDLKYGKGVRVDAEANSQGMLYALGVLDLVHEICDIKRVLVIIDQPRLDHLSRWEISSDELLQWAKDITPVAIDAFNGSDRLTPGEHCHDGFCKARHTCPALAAEAMAAFEDNDTIPGVMSPEQIAALLPRLPRIKAWAEGLLTFAWENAQLGVKYPGWKLVAGRQTRKWSDEYQVAKVLEAEGVEPWTRKLISITEAEKTVGKKHPVFELTVKTEGRPALVPESDKRAEYVASATIDASIDTNFTED